MFRTFRKGLQSARNGAKVVLVPGRFRDKDSNSVPSLDFQNNLLLERLLLPIRAVNPYLEVDGVNGVARSPAPTTTSRAVARARTWTSSHRIARRTLCPTQAARRPEDGFRRCKIGLFVRDQFLDNHFDEFVDFAASTGTLALRELVRDMVSEQRWSPADPGRLRDSRGECPEEGSGGAMKATSQAARRR